MKCHPRMKHDENFYVNGLPGRKVPWVNSVCESMGEMNSTRAGRISSWDPKMKTLNAKHKFFHPSTNFILGQNLSQFSCKQDVSMGLSESPIFHVFFVFVYSGWHVSVLVYCLQAGLPVTVTNTKMAVQ